MRRFLIPGLLALAGLVSLAVLFPRFDPDASLGQTLDRAKAIRKAREVAAKYGVQAADWQAAVTEMSEGTAQGTTIEVGLRAPGRNRSVTLTLLPDGRLVEFTPHGVAALPVPPGDLAAPAHREDGPSRKGARRIWTSKSGNVNIQENEGEASKPVYWPMRVIPVFWYIAVFVAFPIGAMRRRIRYRVPLILVAAQILWAAISYWGGSNYQRALVEHAASTRSLFSLMMTNTPAAEGWAFLWLFLFAAVGFSIRAVNKREKWASLELLAQGAFMNRAVGASVAYGLLCGAGIAALPYLIAATRLFPSNPLALRFSEVLVAPSPASMAWALSTAVLPLGLFGFAYPLAAKIQRPVFRWGLFTIAGIAIVGGSRVDFTGPAANLVLAVLLFAAYTLLYWYTDLLATIFAAIAVHAVITPFALLSQPAGGIRATAIPVILSFVVLLAVSLRAAVRGSEGADAIPETPALADDPADAINETGRVRLEAEFDVARKAQQDALPSLAPPLHGYTLAGSCEPAQQVGGDLYDYFTLSDGRLAIAVADVSGKGVPAALYMMVTKGLLAAATRDSSDLAYILEQTNRHLYRACKKKVFVTLAAVALDPAARRLQHGRAGHNPTVWRRTSRDETVFLKPPGLGLGMTAGDRFNRTLKIEELELEPGDAVVLYSDGVTEAVDSSMDQFGEERLIRAVESTDGLPAEESRAAILRELGEFVGATPARDDITLVVLRVEGIAVP